LSNVKLTLVVGKYAQAYHFPNAAASLTEIVQAWRKHWPIAVPLPHPSPRNNLWLKQNPWFKAELIPILQMQVAEVLGG
jgi:uracil-DNA glycosylase